MLPLQQNGGHNEKTDLSSRTSSTVNGCLRGLVRSSHATDGFAITKPIGTPADRLHLCWCALPLGPHLGLHSKEMCVCALRCLLWLSLEIPIKPLALALLVNQRRNVRGRFFHSRGSRDWLSMQPRSLTTKTKPAPDGALRPLTTRLFPFPAEVSAKSPRERL